MKGVSSLCTGLAVIWLAAVLPQSSGAQAKTPVSIELVLAVDTSISVDEVEFKLQMAGIASALRTPDIIALIQQHSGVAVTLFQWNSTVDPRYAIPWHLLHDAASVLDFADKVERATRDPARGFTAIGRAIDFGVRLIAENEFSGQRLKIDVSGDGRNNVGVLPAVARRDAQAHGIVINGLPVLIDTYNLDTYFREKIILGPGAFVEIAKDYGDFARAFLRKLRREIAPMTSSNDALEQLARFSPHPPGQGRASRSGRRPAGSPRPAAEP